MALKQNKTFCLWFTGLSGSGKTTLANEVARILDENNIINENLDGDEIREGISRDLGFSMEDRTKHNERIIFVSKLLVRNNVPTIVAFISPTNEIREMARERIKNLILVHVDCSLDECIRRDVKGLYKKALAGEIKNYTGIDSPFDDPIDPEIVLNTEEREIEDCVNEVMEYLKDNQYVVEE